MEIRVLGKSPAATDAGGACSGYLVRQDDFSLLLDCGSGVFGSLRSVTDYGAVDAVLITHLHADHFLDLIPFSFALKYSPRAPFKRPVLWAPPGSRDFFRRLGAVIRFNDQIETVFDLHEYEQTTEAQIGPFKVRFQEVPHYIETYACDLTTADGARFTFGADCGPNEALERFAQGTDLLAVEATEATSVLPDEDDIRGHMTAREAGELAANAQAKRVLITHFSDELDPAALLSEAQAGFGAPVEIAREGAQYSV